MDLRRCDSFRAFSRSDDGVDELAEFFDAVSWGLFMLGPLKLLVAVPWDGELLPDDNPAEMAASIAANGSTSSA